LGLPSPGHQRKVAVFDAVWLFLKPSRAKKRKSCPYCLCRPSYLPLCGTNVSLMPAKPTRNSFGKLKYVGKLKYKTRATVL
jgi:hypothetical protein